MARSDLRSEKYQEQGYQKIKNNVVVRSIILLTRSYICIIICRKYPIRIKDTIRFAKDKVLGLPMTRILSGIYI